MSIVDRVPPLDDRNYDAIVAEMRSRVSRYTPEWKPVWTDLNDSDPGITMLQVFGWLAEMLLYRMNRIPELGYLKFLELLGIELRPREPAMADITFPVLATALKPTVIVPTGTQVIAETEGGGPPLVFEATRSLTCLNAQLAAVLSGDGRSVPAVVTESNDMATGFEPLGPTASVDSVLMLGFKRPPPFPEIDLTLFAWVAGQESTERGVTCGLPATAAFAPADLMWEYWNGFDWVALQTMKDGSLAFTRTGEIVLRVPGGALGTAVMPGEPAALFWIRARVTRNQYERVPQLIALRPNTMRLLQMETVRNEVLGGSTGRRDQVFALSNTPVLADSLRLQIDQGSGSELWSEVDDFFGSGPDDLHYVLNRTSGEIRFGDGFHGAIPIANVDNPQANVVAVEYRFGGGTAGNVAAGHLGTLRNAVEGIDDNRITNVQPTFGGREEETLDEAKQRAPGAVRSRCRAVTGDDFEYFAKQAANIKRARAMPRTHPEYPGAEVPGAVTVVVIPDAPGPKPLPSEGTLRTVCAYLDARRLLTTELYVVPPTYQLARVDVDITAVGGADTAAVTDGVTKSLGAYFHPLTGGDDGEGWPFGGTVRFSRVFQRIFTVPGVESIDRVVISIDGQAAPECRDIDIKPGAVLYSLDHDVSVRYASTGAR